MSRAALALSFLCLIAATTPTRAPKWINIGSTQDGSIQYFADSGAMEIAENGYFLLWTRDDFPTPVSVNGKFIKSKRFRNLIDCQQRRYRIVQAIQYYTDNTRQPISFDETWNTPPSATVEDGFVTAICDNAARAHR